MAISEEAKNNKPKKPLNAYMRFRNEKLKELKDDPDKSTKVKKMWEEIDPKQKQQMEAQYKEGLQQHKKDFEDWKLEYNISDEDLKEDKPRKSRKKKDDTDDQERKPIKTKGTKETKEENKKKEAQKKPTKSAEKERGKSKKTGKEADKKKK